MTQVATSSGVFFASQPMTDSKRGAFQVRARRYRSDQPSTWRRAYPAPLPRLESPARSGSTLCKATRVSMTARQSARVCRASSTTPSLARGMTPSMRRMT